MIYNHIYELIGNTPILQFNNDNYSMANIFAKLEYFNPGGSVKDRIAKNMIFSLLEKGEITQNTTLVEPTSGNTGIGLAMVCASLGMSFIATMPESMSIERRQLLSAYGAKIILTNASEGMQGAIDKANSLCENPNYYMLNQFSNEYNPKAHEENTALEIIKDFEQLDVLVAGIGTGGTITGLSTKLKQHFPNLHIVGVEPLNSPFLTKGEKGPHAIQGIGAGFKPSILNTNVIDEIVCVSNEDAFTFAKKAGTTQGVLLGISGGAAYKVAQDFAIKYGNEKNILFIAPDNGERYLSTALYQSEK